MALELAVCEMVESMPDAQAIDAAELRARLRPLCDDAIRLGVRAERFVLLLKNACARSPKSRFLAPYASAPGARLVSLAIDEYYKTVDRAEVPLSRVGRRSVEPSLLSRISESPPGARR